MSHAIRLMMADTKPLPLSGVVEVDEKYLGGKPRPRTDGVKAKRGKGGGAKVPATKSLERLRRDHQAADPRHGRAPRARHHRVDRA